MVSNTDQIKASASIEKVIAAYVELKKEGSRYIGLCPFHSEKTPSFVVTPKTEQNPHGIYKCFGCQEHGDVFGFIQKIENKPFPEAVRLVAEKIGISVAENGPRSDKPSSSPLKAKTASLQTPPPAAATPPVPKHVATYDYRNAEGELLYEVLRYEPGKHGKPKDFRQRRPLAGGGWAWGLTAGWYKRGPNGDWYVTKEPVGGDIELPETERVLWRLPQTLAADEVVLVEGERDVLTLEKLGFTATTVSGGSQQPWLPSYTEALRGKRVLIFPDNDAPGEAHGRKVEKSLQNVAAELVYVPMPKGFKDVTDYVEAGRTADDIHALITQSEQETLEADRRRRGLLSVVEVVMTYRGGQEAFHDPQKRPKGLLTGYHQFDEMTGGLQGGELFTLAGRPAMGKTTIGLCIAGNVAARQHGAVAVFSLEMSAASLLERMVCARASIDSLKFRSGYCNAEELKAFHQASREIARLPIFFSDYTPLDPEGMRRKLGILMETKEVSLAVLDYLQLCEASGHSGRSASIANRVNEISVFSRHLKLLCREFNIPIIALSQLSRACDIRPGDHRPILSDLRDSGSIEQDSDLVGFVYRQEVYRPDKPELRGRAELILAKQRNGPTGKVKLEFKHKFNRFDNPSSQWTDVEEAA